MNGLFKLWRRLDLPSLRGSWLWQGPLRKEPRWIKGIGVQPKQSPVGYSHVWLRFKSLLSHQLFLGVVCCSSSLAATYTTNYNLCKPADDEYDYGACLRGNLDTIDRVLISTSNFQSLNIPYSHIDGSTITTAINVLNSSSGSFSATGATVYTLTTSSGIHIINGGQLWLGTGSSIRYPNDSISTSALSGAYAAPGAGGGSSGQPIIVSSCTEDIPNYAATATVLGTAVTGSSVTIILPVGSSVTFSGHVDLDNSSAGNFFYKIYMGGASPTQLTANVASTMGTGVAVAGGIIFPSTIYFHTAFLAAGTYTFYISVAVQAGTTNFGQGGTFNHGNQFCVMGY